MIDDIMNIVDVFSGKTTSLLSGSEQAANEKLVELATFFYKIDMRVSLEEQAYMDELLKTIDWDSSVSVESFQRDCIAKINAMFASSGDKVSLYLSDLMQEISDLGSRRIEEIKNLHKNVTYMHTRYRSRLGVGARLIVLAIL